MSIPLTMYSKFDRRPDGQFQIAITYRGAVVPIMTKVGTVDDCANFLVNVHDKVMREYPDFHGDIKMSGPEELTYAIYQYTKGWKGNPKYVHENL